LLRSGVEQRQAAIAQSQPATGSLSAFSRMFGGVAVILFCILGGGMAVAISNGLYSGDAGSLSSGFLGALMVFGLLAWLGRSYGPVNWQRFLLLAGGCALGGLGVMMLSAPFNAIIGLPGLAVGVVGLVAVWTAVLRR
jgi:hypothetical protein